MQASDLLTRAVANKIPEKLAEEKLKSGKKLRVYWGIDPTGSQIHLGHTVPLRKLRAFADAGHEVILVIGSFTAMIGDPSGQDTLRVPLTREKVELNFRTYKKQASKIIDFSKIEVRENHEWLEKLRFEDIVKLASHFTKQQIEQRDMFQRREKEGKAIHLHELFYPLMVGYDSVMLDVDCEIGGSDQEFNMLAGRTMQKAFGKREKFVLTTKLIEGLDGRKMSKTYENCVYLEDPPKEMYGKLLSLHDELIPTYMECCTDIPMEEVKVAAAAIRQSPRSKAKELKMRLAREIVSMYHGAHAAAKAEEEFEKVFKEKGTPEDMKEVKVKKGSLLIDVLVEHGLVDSKSKARKLIEQGGVKVNDEVVAQPSEVAREGIVKVGKRKFLRIKWQN